MSIIITIHCTYRIFYIKLWFTVYNCKNLKNNHNMIKYLQINREAKIVFLNTFLSL